MEFGIEKCAMLIMNSGKREITEDIELLNQKRIRMLGEKKNYKCLAIVGADTIEQAEMKEKNFKNSSSNKQNIFSKPNTATEISLKK